MKKKKKRYINNSCSEEIEESQVVVVWFTINLRQSGVRDDLSRAQFTFMPPRKRLREFKTQNLRPVWSFVNPYTAPGRQLLRVHIIYWLRMLSIARCPTMAVQRFPLPVTIVLFIYIYFFSLQVYIANRFPYRVGRLLRFVWFFPDEENTFYSFEWEDVENLEIFANG